MLINNNNYFAPVVITDQLVDINHISFLFGEETVWKAGSLWPIDWHVWLPSRRSAVQIPHPTSPETHMWRNAGHTWNGKVVTPEVNVREHISHNFLPSANKVVHSCFEILPEAITISLEQGYWCPQNWNVSAKIKKKLFGHKYQRISCTYCISFQISFLMTTME